MLFEQYEKGDFFDEMFASNEGDVFPHYHPLYQRLQTLQREQFQERQQRIDDTFLKNGITFTVYGDKDGTERIFPSI